MGKSCEGERARLEFYRGHGAAGLSAFSPWRFRRHFDGRRLASLASSPGRFAMRPDMFRIARQQLSKRALKHYQLANGGAHG